MGTKPRSERETGRDNGAYQSLLRTHAFMVD